jgi:Fe-S oxidoreductase
MNEYCLICGVALGEYERELCSTCYGFFQKRYKHRFKKGLGRFRENSKFLDEWRSQSSEKEVNE